MKILATDGLDREAVDLLQNAGFEVDVRKGCAKDELAKIIGWYDAIIIRTTTKITADILQNKGELKVICSQTAGFDGIDVESTKEKGVVVMNVASCNANAVAELTIAHMLCLARRIPQADASLRNGLWVKQRLQPYGTELAGKILGVVGLGHIGRLVAKKAQGLDMKVCAADPFVSPEAAKQIGVELVGLHVLLQTADFISMHVPLDNSTNRMFGQKEFALMKDGAFFINCARGELVDSNALKDVMRRGKINAALDVFENEPKSDDEPLKIDEEIIILADVLTPHLGGSTREARKNAAIGAAQQIIEGLAHNVWRNAINLPPSDAALKPYMELAEKLGQFVARLWFVGEPKQFFSIQFEYFGSLANKDTRIVTQAGLQGLISAFSSSGPVGLVNAPIEAKHRGFKVSELSCSEPINYSNLIALEISGKNGEKHRLEGVLSDGVRLQIVKIDGYPIVIEPSKIMLVFANKDEVGVIRRVAEVLEDLNINIEKFALSDRNRDGTAMAAVTLSSKPAEGELMARIKLKLEDRIRFIKLLVF